MAFSFLTAPRSLATATEVVTRINIYVPVQDARDFLSSIYRATLSEDRTKICYTEPKIARYLWKKPSLIQEADKKELREPKIIEQHHIVAVQIDKNHDRLKCKRVLVAPPGLKFVNTLFYEGARGLNLVGEIKSTGVKFVKGDLVLPQTFYFVRWSVDVEGTEEPLVKEDEDKNEEEKLAKLVRGTKDLDIDDES